jgi:hypothetical protein
MSEGKTKALAFTAKDKFKLWTWLRKNKTRIEQERVKKEDAARQATADLGFSITAANMTGGGKVVGIKWSGSGTGERSLRALKEHSFLTRLRKLEAQMGWLLNELGIPDPCPDVPQGPPESPAAETNHSQVRPLQES